MFTPKKITSNQNVMFQSKSIKSIIAFYINNVTKVYMNNVTIKVNQKYWG